MKHSTLCLISPPKVDRHFNLTKNCEGALTLTQLPIQKLQNKWAVDNTMLSGVDDAEMPQNKNS